MFISVVLFFIFWSVTHRIEDFFLFKKSTLISYCIFFFFSQVQAEAQLAGITLEYQKIRAKDEKMRQEMLTVQAAKEGVFVCSCAGGVVVVVCVLLGIVSLTFFFSTLFSSSLALLFLPLLPHSPTLSPGLMKQAYAFRSVVRSDTQAIKKLMEGGKTAVPGSDGPTTDVATKTTAAADEALDKKAEASELASIEKQRAATKKVEEADVEDSKASDTALEHMLSPAFEAGGAAGGASGAAGASGPAT